MQGLSDVNRHFLLLCGDNILPFIPEPRLFVRFYVAVLVGYSFPKLQEKIQNGKPSHLPRTSSHKCLHWL